MKIKEIAPGAKIGVGVAKFRAKLLEEGVERRSEELESDAETVVERLENGNRKCHLLRRAVRTEERLVPGLRGNERSLILRE